MTAPVAAVYEVLKADLEAPDEESEGGLLSARAPRSVRACWR